MDCAICENSSCLWKVRFIKRFPSALAWQRRTAQLRNTTELSVQAIEMNLFFKKMTHQDWCHSWENSLIFSHLNNEYHTLPAHQCWHFFIILSCIYIQRYKLVKVILITRLCSLPTPMCLKYKPSLSYIRVYITNSWDQFSPCCNTTCINFRHHFALAYKNKY